MAAIPEAYTGLSLYQNDCEHSIAKLDTDYNTMKTRFYLDEVVGTKEGVVGLVNPLGANAKYHNLVTRQGKGRFGNYVALNDGGLNTKADVTSQSILTNYIGSFKVTGNFKSAFYSNNTFVGIRYRIAYDGGTTYGSWVEDLKTDSSSNAINTTFTVDLKLNDINYSNVGFESAVEWQIFIENEEGRFTYPTTIENSVRLIPILLRTSTGGSPQTYYTNTDDSQITTSDSIVAQANLITQLFTSSNGLAPYLPYVGILYRDDNPDIQYTFDTDTVDGVTKSNYLTNITDIGIPSVSWIPITYVGFGNSSAQACNKAALGTQSVTYYINSVTLKVHSTVSGAFPTNQFYIDFNDGINYRIISMTDGVRTDTGSSCSI